MKKTIKTYSITPARGQALLAFEGRRFPDSVELYETEISEEVRGEKDKTALERKQTELNADFRNLLISGDCLSACAHLKSQNTKIDLVYIDPPFASGANYAKKIYLRNSSGSEIQADGTTIGEEVMYGDIWQKEDYLNWLYERLLAIREVMSETGSIYVHLDWHIGHYVKIMMDEVFGEENFVNEVIWSYRRWTAPGKGYQNMHDTLFFYSNNVGDKIFNRVEVEPTTAKKRALELGYHTNVVNSSRGKIRQLLVYNKEKVEQKIADGKINTAKYDRIVYIDADKVVAPDVWADIQFINSQALERTNYATQKPESLLERIIKASSDEGMIVADFFSGSGTTAKVAHDLNRKFIACDIGINALQTTRDRLAEVEAEFDVLKIKDGLRLFRNPAQTTAKIFGIVDGFKSRKELDLGSFWDGGIAKPNGSYSPVKFVGIENLLTKELLDVFLEEVYKLEDGENNPADVMIIYAHKDGKVNQDDVNKSIYAAAKTELKVQLVSLDDLLEDKRDAIFASDNANISTKKPAKGSGVEVKIEKFFSPYLYKKIEEYNAKKTKTGTVEQSKSKAITISSTGLELIESVQFNTAGTKAWKSNPKLEDKAGKTSQIKGTYSLKTDKFKMKIRNIAGDEIVINSKDIK